MHRAAWLGMGILLSCGEPANAVLEVRMRLPQRVDAHGDTERRFARIAVLPSDKPISAAGQFAKHTRVFDLSRSGCNVELSIVADDPRKDAQRLERGDEHGLSLVVWFCASEDSCDGRDAPKWLIDFDKALWVGERTIFEADLGGGECSNWSLSRLTLPSVQRPDGGLMGELDYSLRVPACDVLGCVDETSAPAFDVGFCRLDGTHPCD